MHGQQVCEVKYCTGQTSYVRCDICVVEFELCNVWQRLPLAMAAAIYSDKRDFEDGGVTPHEGINKV